MKVTVFASLYELKKPSYVELDYVIDAIKNEKFKSLVESIRGENDKGTRNNLKKKLACILFSGVFTERLDNAITEHSGIICLDFDGFETNEILEAYKSGLKNDEYVHCVFDSPSGDGLKVLVKIPSSISEHREYFNGLKEHFSSEYFDESCVNESRICYISSDPNIYVNDFSSTFDKKVKAKEVTKTQQTIDVYDKDRVIQGLYKWWSDRYGLVEGERNRNVYILSMAFNEFGIPEVQAKSFMSDFAHDGFDNNEISLCVESAYRKTHLFNTKVFTDDVKFDIYTPNDIVEKEKVSINFHNIYESAFVDVTKKIEHPPVAISMGCHTMGKNTYPTPFGTYGNFSCIVGASKSKKTFLKSLIVSSFIGKNTNLYTSTIKGHRDRECFVIDIDTEQSSWHAQNVFKRVMRTCGMENYEFYKPFALRKYDPKQRLEFIEWLIYESEMKDNIGLISIDGLADLVDDFNDLKESQRLINKVMKWTDDKQFHLTTILHSNYGSAKAVGHIGSSMLKKAETVCSVVNDGEVVRASFTHTRGFPIEEFAYRVNSDGIPFLVGEYSDQSTLSKIYKEEVLLEDKKELPFISPGDAFGDIPF
jgi:hypothetical protein